MAEKEERISVIVYEKDPCKNCPGNPMTDCQVCEKDLRYDGGMTRQEAICKIARSICRAGGNECIGDCESCDLWEVGPEKDYAEAALNALLEGK